MDYRMWLNGEVGIGGLLKIPPDAAAHGMRPVWVGYINVDDVDATVGAVTAAGGTVQMPATDIPGVGRIAMVSDPEGAAFYVMRPAGTGESSAHAPGKPGHGGWHELHARDAEAALSFYARIAGWKQVGTHDMGPMGLYRLFGPGPGPESMLGGMMNSPTFPRPMWLYYFNVEHIDAAKARVEAAGGTVLAGPHQVPGGLWMIRAQDTEGAMFGLLAPLRG
jgi:predicted enzyme related to lactoylglutathione lyase